MPATCRIEAVLFDADGVVQSTAPGWRAALASLCGETGRSEEFLEQIFAAERPTLVGRGSFEVALEQLLADWGCQATAEQALRVWEMIEPASELLGVVDALRAAGTRVGLATNQQQIRARFMEVDLGYRDRFDDLFFSCRIGHAKPSPKYFARVLEELDLEGRQVLFIDDHPDNVVAACESGFNGELFRLTTGAGAMLELLKAYDLPSRK